MLQQRLSPTTVVETTPLPETFDAERVAPDADSLTLYLNEIGQTPLLTPAAEVELARRVEAGDAEALRDLTRANLRLVVSIARHYAYGGLTMLDLIQEGNLGLLRAASRFDWRVGVRFATYASWWVRQAITHALTSQTRLVRLPARTSEQVRQLRRQQRDLSQRLGRVPATAELAEALGVTPRRVAFLQQVAQRTISLDLRVGEDQEETLGAILPADGIGPEEQVVGDLLRAELEQAILDLPETRRRVLSLRFGLGGEEPLSLAAAGAEIGLSREGVRRIEQQALAALRRRLDAPAALARLASG